MISPIAFYMADEVPEWSGRLENGLPADDLSGRDEWIRTTDLLVPNLIEDVRVKPAKIAVWRVFEQ